MWHLLIEVWITLYSYDIQEMESKKKKKKNQLRIQMTIWISEIAFTSANNW